MAKGRKKTYINQLREPDKKMARMLANCHVATKEQMLSTGFSEKRLLNYQRDNLVQKKVFYNKESKKDEFAYCLTKKGESFFRKNLNIEYFYTSTSISHDLNLTKVYLSLDESRQQYWITENEFREKKELFLEDLKQNDIIRYNEISELDLSPPDGGYYVPSDSQDPYETSFDIITIEIIGDYNSQQIQSKINYVEVMGYGKMW